MATDPATRERYVIVVTFEGNQEELAHGIESLRQALGQQMVWAGIREAAADVLATVREWGGNLG